MKNKGILFSLCSCLLLGGVNAYLLIGNHKLKESNELKIAVINLDQGVHYQKKNRFFSKELLQFNDLYTLTSFNEAKDGLQQGKYSASFIIPSDFSANAISLVSQPKRSLIKYQVSPMLDDYGKLMVEYKIQEIMKDLNKQMSYMYVSNIIDEFHTGQDTAKKMIFKEQTLLKEVKTIQPISIVDLLKLEDYDSLEKTVYQDYVSPYIEKNNRIINQIDLSYTNALMAMENQLKENKQKQQLLLDKSEQIITDFLTYPFLMNEEGKCQIDFSSLHQYIDDFKKEFISQMNQIKKITQQNKQYSENYIQDLYKKLDDFLENEMNVFEENIKTYSEELLSDIEINEQSCPCFYASLNQHEDYIKNIQLLNQQMIRCLMDDQDIEELLEQESMQEALKKINAYQKTQIKTLNEFVQENQVLTLNHEEIKKVLKEELDKELEVKKNLLYAFITDKKEKMYASFNDELKEMISLKPEHESLESIFEQCQEMNFNQIDFYIHQDLQNYSIKQKDFFSKMYQILLIHQKDNQIMEEQWFCYDPMMMINKEELKMLQDEFLLSNRSLKEKIIEEWNNSEEEKDEMIQKINNDIEQMRQEIKQCQNLSQEKVNEALRSFLTLQQALFEQNQMNMEQFIQQLKNTRSTALTSEDMNEFIVLPIQLEKENG